MRKSEFLHKLKLAALVIIVTWSIASVVDAEAHKSVVADYGTANIFRIIDSIGRI